MNQTSILSIAFACLVMGCSSVEIYMTTASSNADGGGGTTTSTSTTMSTSITTTIDTSSGGAGGEGGSSVCPPSDFVPEQKVTIMLDPSTPFSTNVVAGKDMWTVFSTYVVTNVTDEAQEIIAAQIQQINANGDAADFVEVGIMTTDGVLRLSGDQYHDGIDHQYFSIDEVEPQGFIVQPNEQRLVQVRARLAPVLSSAAAGNAWHGVPRSGHTDALRLQQLQLASDPFCVAQTSTEANNPWMMVVRKSVPTIMKHPLPTNTLYNGDQDLIKWQVAADSAGPVAVKMMLFNILGNDNFSLSDFLVRRGATDLPVSDYMIDISVTQYGSSWDGWLQVAFTNEEMILGSGSVFTLHASVSGATQGDALVIGTHALADHAVTTGSLESYSITDWWNAGIGVYDSNTDWHSTPSFVWSDLSELPHGSVIGQSSVDWTNDAMIGWDMAEALTL